MSQVLLPAGLILLALATPSARAGETLSRTRYLMGTTCEIEADVSAKEIESAFEEIARVEGFLSTWRNDTELSRLNRSGGKVETVSRELFDVLASTVDWARRTDGAFNPLVAPLIEVWNVRSAGAEPSEHDIVDARSRSRLDALSLESATRAARLAAGSAIEEGAFGKGYALDRVSELLSGNESSEYLVDFGGQIAVRSSEARTVAIAHPASRNEPAVTVRVRQGSLATTSGSEKWFETSQGRLSHVVDPRSGRALPPRGSATVIHESALVADILSTALYVMGPEEGIRWADANGIAAIFIVPDGERWAVRPSKTGNNPVLGLTMATDDFYLKGQP